MKQTLLQMTQDILSAMSSDEVNSINDTTEAQQVATCIKTAYFNMVAKYDLPEHNQLFQLSQSDDASKPVLMNRPDGVSRIEWIKYWDSNPNDNGSGTQVSQYGSYSHDLNTDIVSNSTTTSSWTASNFEFLGPPSVGSTFTLSNVTSITGTGTPAVGQTISISTADTGTDLTVIGDITVYTPGTPALISIKVTKLIGSLIVTSNNAGQNSNWAIASGDISSNQGPGYQPIRILSLEDFLHVVNTYNILDTDISQMDLTIINGSTGLSQNFSFKYRTDIQPKYCCVVDEKYFVFDAYDSTQESTLQASKTLCSGWVIPSWSMTDSFYPNIDENMFPMLYNEAKALAFFELKQTPHQKAEQEVTRQRSSLQKFKNIAERPGYFDALPNFGRRGGGTGR